MIKRYTVSVLGCGWFGFPLAKELVQAGYRVKGSTTTEHKLAALQSAGIEPHLLNLNDKDIDAGNFFDSDVLFLGVPPRTRAGNEDNYVEKISRVVERMKGSIVKQVIFISSTSVFSDTNSVIDERSVPSPGTASGAAILAAEMYLRDCPGFTTTIVRFAGLIGPGRDPGRFFSGKSNIPEGLSPVNLIHLDDCLGIARAILQQEAFGYTFHAVTPQHPSRNDFYRKASAESGFTEPEFIVERHKWKIIESFNVPTLLNYAFKQKI